jgi:energy-coupling factor transporter ATP-binding protein EcfA2
MTLSDKYSINVRYQRSTRIDSDLDLSFFNGLVYHGTAAQTLGTIIEQFKQAKQSTFTVTGPYGSGKSTIALLMSGLLHPDQAIRNAAVESIGNSKDCHLFYKAFGVTPNKGNGWLIIRSVGGVGEPVDVIWAGIQNALKEHPNTSGLLFLNQEKPSSDVELLDYIDILIKEIGPSVDGILFILDEMGKVLENISRQSTDLHLFQDLAEKLSRASQNDVPCVFLGLLHQAISEYAVGLGVGVQSEWGKVQGRYSDIPYQVSTDETLALIGKSIVGPHEASNEFLSTSVLSAVAGSSLKLSSEMIERLGACYPLHPSTAILLGPLSKRRFSQNERSTFSFLNSREPHSFQQFLQDTEIDDTYRLSCLWDYLEANVEHLIVSSPDGHPWSLAEDALIRASKQADVKDIHLELIKAVALINLFGRKHGFYASDQLIQASLDQFSEDDIQKALLDLKEWSLVTRRKHLSAWAIFEGADIDISELVEEKVEQLAGDDSWIENLEYSNYVIAKRHYHEFGVLRWMSQRLIRNTGYLASKDVVSRKDGAFASFVMVAESTGEETSESSMRELSKHVAESGLAISYCPNLSVIKSHAIEVYALQELERELPELQNDKIAQKEHEIRLVEATRALQDAFVDGFETATWWFNGYDNLRESLSVIASEIADELYPKCPAIFNELIGRSKVSGTSVSARKKLMMAMVDDGDQENLGIDGFPPEKAIYLTCLKNLGLHGVNANGDIGFMIPESGEIKALLSAAEELIKNESGDVVTLDRVSSLWTEAPFGVAEGVIPVLMLAMLLSQDENLAFYDKDSTNQYVYVPDIDDVVVNKIAKSPKDVAVRYFEVQGVKRQYISSMASLASQQFEREVPESALAIARPIVTFVHQLPQWVKVTRNLSTKTTEFRDLVLKANDPYRLLLEDFIGLFDLNDVPEEEYAERIKIQLSSCLDELKSKQAELINTFTSVIENELGVIDESLVAQCEKVRELAADYRMQAFAQRMGLCLTNNNWLANVVALVGNTPERNWNDVSLAKAKEELHEFCQRFKRIRVFSSQLSSSDASTKSIALVVGDGQEAQEFVRHVEIPDSLNEKIEDITNQLRSTLAENGLTEDMQAYVLQEALRCLMTEYQPPACEMKG